MLVKTGVLETETEIIIRIEQVLIFLVAFVFVFVLDMKLWSYLLHIWTEKLKQEGKNILERLISKAGLVAKREKSGSHSCLTQKKRISCSTPSQPWVSVAYTVDSPLICGPH